ncbi:PKD domain-containing protein [Flavobacterium aquiphilum]|uniref:PKD domain-containing protein n=1 Tax=Flavobacterium aquiphilum TaxID=3003261 RepID=UPI002480053C|nr:hypothetical protein [Flavobacterium aquiphilum]
MGYYVDIIDQVLRENLFVIEKASRSAIVLAWNGGDEKDGLSIVGSSLTFDFAHNELIDAKFMKFFTGDEIRFKVELKQTEDDSMIWQGFVVPDQYAEPYTNGVTFVKFTASCGLGRLKGKYLPDDFYNDEKSVIAIFCKILTLTSVDINLIFNPAIENSVQKDWDKIYIDTLTFADKNKKMDAYSILDMLLKDMLCVCFQSDNCWQIEGINKRHIRGIDAKRYNIQTGELIGSVIDKKLLKKVTAYVTPSTTMVPPYNMISVTHKRVEPSLPETIAKESNDGWVVMSGVVGEIYATDWNGNNNYFCKCIAPNYQNSIKKEWVDPDFTGNISADIAPFDETKFINLKNKIYVYKYQKLTISASFTIIKFANVMEGVDETDWYNTLLYSFELNDEILFSNRKITIPENENIIFSSDGVAKLNFDVIIQEEGLLDIKLWRPFGNIPGNNILGFEITEMKVSPVAFNENYEVVDVISDEFTIDKEIELTYADDDSAFSKSFRLAKLKEATVDYNEIEVPILDQFMQNGINYSVVHLDGANLISDNKNTTYHEGILLEDIGVIYNYYSSDRMVVQTTDAVIGSFVVRVYKNNDYVDSRVSWMQWTDSVYKIETSRYGQIVANIIRRMFNVASEKMDMVVHNAIKFNDLILFKYVYDKSFVVTNLSWDIDLNKSTLTLSRAVYRDSGDSGSNPENIPPIVNAGTDIVLTDAQTTASLLATAYDVDGYIVSQIWTKLEGGFGDIIMSPNQLATDLQNLTEDSYKYQIQVTDNDGATATDTISITRIKDYAVSLDLIGTTDDLGFCPKYQLIIDPNIPASFNLLLKGSIWLTMNGSGLEFTFSGVRILRNGVVIFHAEHSQTGDAAYEVTFSIGYLSTDEIIFELPQRLALPMPIEGSNSVYLKTIDFVNGSGNIIGLPVHAQYVPGPF